MQQKRIWQPERVSSVSSNTGASSAAALQRRAVSTVGRAATSGPATCSRDCHHKRAFWIPQTPHILSLVHLYPENIWTSFPANQRQWLEHVYGLSHGEDADSGEESLSLATRSKDVSNVLSAAIQFDPPLVPLELLSFGGCPKGDRDPDFYANVGSAIRTLREDIPILFQRDLTYDIYRPDIVFRDPRNHFEGLRNYKIIFWSLRFHGQLFFSQIQVVISRLWQPDDMTLRMRWTVVGTPRVPWEAKGTFDGVSNFRLDKSGKIYEHQVDNVVFRDPPLQSPLFAGLQLLTGGPSRQPVPNMVRGFSKANSIEPIVQAPRYPAPVQVAHRGSDTRWTTSKGC